MFNSNLYYLVPRELPFSLGQGVSSHCPQPMTEFLEKNKIKTQRTNFSLYLKPGSLPWLFPTAPDRIICRHTHTGTRKTFKQEIEPRKSISYRAFSQWLLWDGFKGKKSIVDSIGWMDTGRNLKYIVVSFYISFFPITIIVLFGDCALFPIARRAQLACYVSNCQDSWWASVQLTSIRTAD